MRLPWMPTPGYRIKPPKPVEPAFRLPTAQRPGNGKRECITVSVKAEGLDEIEKQLDRINVLLNEVNDRIGKLQSN